MEWAFPFAALGFGRRALDGAGVLARAREMNTHTHTQRERARARMGWGAPEVRVGPGRRVALPGVAPQALEEVALPRPGGGGGEEDAYLQTPTLGCWPPGSRLEPDVGECVSIRWFEKTLSPKPYPPPSPTPYTVR